MNRRFRLFYKELKVYSKKQIIKILYDYLGKDKENGKESKRSKRS